MFNLRKTLNKLVFCEDKVMKKNGFQEFENREDLLRAKELNFNLLATIDSYNKTSKNDLDTRINILKKIIEIFETLKIEAFDIDEEAYKKFEEKLRYLEYKRNYIKEYGIEEVDIEQVRRESEQKRIEDEENLRKYREEVMRNKSDKEER